MQYGPVPDFPIKGKIVAITGGGSGIGFALARKCHENGARVIVGDLKLVAEAEQYVSKANPAEICFQHCDVTSWKSLHDLISASVKMLGDVPDVYVPSAGVRSYTGLGSFELEMIIRLIGVRATLEQFLGRQ